MWDPRWPPPACPADLEDAAEAAARSHKKAALAWEAEREALRSEAELRHAQARQQLQAAAEELEAVRAAHAREASQAWPREPPGRDRSVPCNGLALHIVPKETLVSKASPPQYKPLLAKEQSPNESSRRR